MNEASMNHPEEIERLHAYLRDAERDDHIKAYDLFECCRWVLPMEYIIETAQEQASSEDVATEIASLKDEDTYLYDLSNEAQTLVLDAIDVNDQRVYVEMSSVDAAEIPTWFYMSPIELGEGWLVHFSDHASSIATNGFRHGLENMYRLGLTTYFTMSAKAHPGYNFAYQTSDVGYAYERWQPRYGKNAVIFWAPYLLVQHHTDEEPQAIFWGPSASNIHQLYGEPGSWWLTDDDGEDREFETLEEVEEYLDDVAVFAKTVSTKKLKSRLLR